MVRIKVKGHYREVIRDEKGRFVKVEKWSSKRKNNSTNETFLACGIK